jgi:isopropylmalate/homocitrate/citramalate synthase
MNPTNTTRNGRTELEQTLETMGVHLSSTAFERAFDRAQRAADQSGSLTRDQLRAIVDDASTGDEVHEGVVESFR